MGKRVVKINDSPSRSGVTTEGRRMQSSGGRSGMVRHCHMCSEPAEHAKRDDQIEEATLWICDPCDKRRQWKQRESEYRDRILERDAGHAMKNDVSDRRF